MKMNESRTGDDTCQCGDIRGSATIFLPIIKSISYAVKVDAIAAWKTRACQRWSNNASIFSHPWRNIWTSIEVLPLRLGGDFVRVMYVCVINQFNESRETFMCSTGEAGRHVFVVNKYNANFPRWISRVDTQVKKQRDEYNSSRDIFVVSGSIIM